MGHDNSQETKPFETAEHRRAGMAEFPWSETIPPHPTGLTLWRGCEVPGQRQCDRGLEFSQRKTFTDYLDDVSSTT